MLNEVPIAAWVRRCRRPIRWIYRFYELVMVNGPAWKALIEEEYGDGIVRPSTSTCRWSARPTLKGDRVKITPCPASSSRTNITALTQGTPEYGFRKTEPAGCSMERNPAGGPTFELHSRWREAAS